MSRKQVVQNYLTRSRKPSSKVNLPASPTKKSRSALGAGSTQTLPSSRLTRKSPVITKGVSPPSREWKSDDHLLRLVKLKVRRLYSQDLKNERLGDFLPSEKETPTPVSSGHKITHCFERSNYPARFKPALVIEAHKTYQKERGFKLPSSLKDDLQILRNCRKQSTQMHVQSTVRQTRSILRSSLPTVKSSKTVQFLD